MTAEAGSPASSALLVAKTIGGRRYWYAQPRESASCRPCSNCYAYDDLPMRAVLVEVGERCACICEGYALGDRHLHAAGDGLCDGRQIAPGGFDHDHAHAPSEKRRREEISQGCELG